MLERLKKYNLHFLLLVILISLIGVVGLIHAGFPLTDDGNWMVIRLSAFYENLRDGQFPVRFLTRLNYGYGYPVSDFLYPLFMYLSVPIHIIGANFQNTVKIILASSIVLSAVFSFLWFRKIFDNLSSFVGSLFYALFPYLLFDVYQRGSVGEVLSLAILPFIFWQIERKNLILTSIGIALLITAHNSLAFLFLPFIFLYPLLRNKKLLKFSVLSIFFGLLISSFFWIPALYDLQYTVFGNTKVSDISVYFVNNNLDLLGLSLLFLTVESIFYLLRKRDRFFSILFLTLLGVAFFTLSFSEVFWRILPFANVIQFPFRLVSLLIPLSAFMSAYLLSKEKPQKKYILVGIYLTVIAISALPFINPKSYQDYPDTFYSTNQDTTTVRNEYMPKWVKNLPASQSDAKVENLNGSEKINVLSVSPNQISFQMYTPVEREIQVNLIYFPGWIAEINGKETKIDYDNPNGLIRINVPKGDNTILIKFKETQVRLLSDIASIIGVIILILFYKKLKLWI